jgi:hypothetical protein
MTEQIEAFIRSLVEEGCGPQEVINEVTSLYKVSPEQVMQIYLSVKGLLPAPAEDKIKESLKLYDSKFAEEAYHLLLLNKTSEQIANHFKVSIYDLNTWRDHIPEFSQSWEKSLSADIAVVQTLLKTCLGFDQQDVKIGFSQGEPIYAPFTKRVPPNLRAIEMWLKAKYPESWRETQYNETKLTTLVENMSDEDLEAEISKLGLTPSSSKLEVLKL